MKTSKILLKISCVLFLTSILTIILLGIFYLEKNLVMDIAINSSIGVMTSSLITFFTSLITYRLEKNNMENKIIYETLAIVRILKSDDYNFTSLENLFENTNDFVSFMQIIEEYKPFTNKNCVVEICEKFSELNENTNIKNWIEEIGILIKRYLQEKDWIKSVID